MRTTLAVLILGAMSASAGDYNQDIRDRIRERREARAIQEQNDHIRHEIHWANVERERQLDRIERQQERIIRELEEE